MWFIILLTGIVTGIVFHMFYQWDKETEMRNRIATGSVLVLRDGLVGRMIDIHRDFDCPDNDDEIAYDVRLFESDTIQHIHKDDIAFVVEPEETK